MLGCCVAMKLGIPMVFWMGKVLWSQSAQLPGSLQMDTYDDGIGWAEYLIASAQPTGSPANR